MRKTRFLVIILTVALVALFAAGCGGSGDTSGDATAGDEGAASTTEETGDESAASTTEETGDGSEADAGGTEVRFAIVNMGTYSSDFWTLSHWNGYNYLKEQLPDLDAAWIDNMPDTGTELEQTLERLVSEGYNLIVTTSFGFQGAAIKMAEKYPDVKFMQIQGTANDNENYAVFDIKEYETTFLLGVLAARMSKSGNIGFVATQPINTVVRSIDGFAYGVKYANPDAKVNLLSVGSWSDVTKEHEAAQTLIDNGSDVIGMFQGTQAVSQACEEAGVYCIAHHADISEFAPKMTLSCYVSNWGPYYVEKVKQMQSGAWEGDDKFLGVAEGYGETAQFNEVVPEEVKAEIEELRGKIESGELSVFAGEVKDNEGNVLVPEGEVMSLDKIIAGDWLLDNINGKRE
jgi:basic membrane protein A